MTPRKMPAAATVVLLCILLLGGWSIVNAQEEPFTNELSSTVTPTRDEISLNGTWQFTPHDGGVNPGVKTSIRVPDAWDALPGFYDTTSATYEKVVQIPQSWSGRQVFLEIYEANWHVDLTVNGVSFPRSSEGIGVPTNIDITSAVNLGAENRIEITVTQAGLDFAGVRPAGTFRWGQNLGLTGDVYLRSYPRMRVADAFVKTSFRDQELRVEYQIDSNTGQDQSLTLTPRVLELSGTPVLNLPAQSLTVQSTQSLTVQQPWADPTLWSPQNPHLYLLETTLSENGQVVDVQRVRFGFREVWTQGTEILLNGTPIVLFADSNDLFQHAFMNYYYALWYDEPTTRQTVAKLLESRNAIRIHQAPAVRPHVLDVFDEEGVLVISESAAYGGSYNQAGQPAFNTYVENALAWIPKWIQRERNHPSIITWSAENELGPGWLTLDEAQLRRLGDRIRASDATRPVIFEGDHACCGSDFNSLHYNQDGPGGDWPTDNDVYQYALRWWDATRPNSQNEYAFVGWHGNGIFEASDGTNYTNLTSMQGTRLRGGLLTRGYRYQGWATMAPHSYIWQWADFYAPEGSYADAFVARSFMSVAAFDIAYDGLGDNPPPPAIPAGSSSFTREIVVYNQETQGSDSVDLIVEARADGSATPFYTYRAGQNVPRGSKKDVAVTIQNLPSGSHWIQLELKVEKDGVLRFSGETRDFWLDGTDADAPAAPTGLTAELSGGGMGRLDRNMVYLTWDLPAPRGDIAGWVLYRDTASDPATVEDEVHLWADRERFEALNAYFDVVPGPGRYYYRIAAKDLKGNVGPYSDQVVVDVTDSESPLRNPGFEMESRLYKDATNQYYADRTWGDQWPLPAILGGSQVRPHAGRYAGLINGDGAHAANAFLDKFFFMQNVPGTAQTYHVGAYVRVDKIWRRGIIYDPNFWISEGLHVAVVGGNGEFWNERYADVVVSPTTLEGWEGDGQWHYVYGNVPATSEAVNIIVKMNGEGDHDPIEPLADAFVDDIVFTPIDQVPPVALVSADAVVAGTGQAVQLNASKSFAFDGNGEPLAPNTGLNYRWEFGDGTSAATAAPEVIYQMPGEYVARVTVTDQSGRQATAQVFVNVSGTQPAVSKTASPAVASSEERVTFSIELFGTGQEVMVEDPLPAEFAYLSAVTTCPSPGPSYDEQTRTVVYTGTPPAGESCRIDIETRVNGTEVESVVNTAFINYGGTLQLSASAEVILDAASVYLPFLGNGS